MSGVAPIGPMQEFSPNRRDDEIDRLEQSSSLPPSDDPQSQVVHGTEQKQAEKSTLYDFKYTGLGSFIDKVF